MPGVRVFETAEALSEAAAQQVVDLARQAVQERGWFAIALSGGRAPEKLYKLLGTPACKEQIPWAETFVFWGDERCVPPESERNNAFQARSIFLDKSPIPPDHIRPIPVDLPPAEAARQYEQMLHTFFGAEPPRFDLILLGLGENGHTASLFPHTEVLQEPSHWVKEVWVDEQKMFRVTMTALLINQARHILFLVTGPEKAEILSTVLTAPYHPALYPAQLIRPEDGKLEWYVDKTAGRFLINEDQSQYDRH